MIVSTQGQSRITMKFTDEFGNNAGYITVACYKVNTIDQKDFISNDKGLVVLTPNFKIGDTLTAKFNGIGYVIIDTTVILKQENDFTLKKDYKLLDEVKVTSRDINLKPDRVVLRFSKFIRRETETLTETISRLPGVISTDKNNFKTVGNKELVVFMDGRKLSATELKAIPSGNIAKSELVIMPALTDGDVNQSILYLTSATNAVNYSYSEIMAGYSIGVQGPNFSINRASRSKGWNSSLLLNYYRYKNSSSSNITNPVANFQQTENGAQYRSALIANYSVTRIFSKTNMLTFGLTGNMIYGKRRSVITGNDISGPIDASATSTYKSPAISGFAVWKKTVKNKNIVSLNFLIDNTPLNQEYQQENKKQPSNLSSSNSLHNTSYSFGGNYKLHSINWSKNTFNNTMILNAQVATSNVERSFWGNTSNDDTAHQSDSKNRFTDKKFNLGYSGSLQNNNWKYELSFILNYLQRESKGNDYSFANAYLYPRFVTSYLLNDKNTLSLSLSIPTLRPPINILVSDTFATSNWVKRSGNLALKQERNYNTELLHTYSGDPIFMQTAFSQKYCENGIVSGRIMQGDSSYLLSYFNKNYWKHSLSNSFKYTFSSDCNISSLITVTHINYLDNTLGKNYKSGFYFEGSVNSTYTIWRGYLIGVFTFATPELTYYKTTTLYPDFSIYYSKNIKKNLVLNFEFSNIFNQKGRQKGAQPFGLIEQTVDKLRAVNLSLTWSFGKSFPVIAGGDGRKVNDDIKKIN